MLVVGCWLLCVWLWLFAFWVFGFLVFGVMGCWCGFWFRILGLNLNLEVVGCWLVGSGFTWLLGSMLGGGIGLVGGWVLLIVWCCLRFSLPVWLGSCLWC